MRDQVERLRARLARMAPGNGRRYTASICNRLSRVAKKMREGGASWQVVGEALGMPVETVRRICVERETSARGFVPVEIAPEIRGCAIVVVMPGGHRVEGLDLDRAVVLLARLV